MNKNFKVIPKQYSNIFVAEALRLEFRNELTAIAKKVLTEIPCPYGSYLKAKYELILHRSNRSKRLGYFFTTTVHSTSSSIEIMKNIFNSVERLEKHFTITRTSSVRTSESETEEIYSNFHNINFKLF
jgi:hypothetical protein